MILTVPQIFQLLIAILIAWWAIKKLMSHYLVAYLMKNRFCIKCADGEKVTLNAPWHLKSKYGVPLFLCEECKLIEFPEPFGEFAQKKGELVLLEGRKNGS